MIFADELPLGPIVPSQAVTIVIVLVVVGFIVNLIGVAVAVLAVAKRKPSIESEFATKAELNQLRSEMKQDMGTMFGKVDTLTSSINHSTNSILRDLGKLEGHREFAEQLVEAIRK